MALHDPVQDDINRQIRSAIPARNSSRRFGIAGQVEDLVTRGELTPEAGERVSLNARANFERDRRIAGEREEARRAALEEKKSKAFLNRRQGEASLATANAALASARPGGGPKVSASALELFGLDPNLAGKVSPTTTRAAVTQQSAAARLQQDKKRLAFQREKEASAQQRRERSAELAEINQARLQTAEQVKTILQDQDISDESKKEISFIVSQALSKIQDPEVPPEVVEELFNEALGETFGDRKKAGILAKKRARERGFFVPE